MHSAAVVPEIAPSLSGIPRRADIVIGIPSYNNAGTMGQVLQSAQAGLAKYFPQFTSVIVNCDAGSTDATPEIVRSSKTGDSHVRQLPAPLREVSRLSFSCHGIPGRDVALWEIFRTAASLKAKACAVVDADLRSVTPEWIDLLVRPVLHYDYDFVAPCYHRHKHDGAITDSIVYPLTRALYGQRIRQPIGGDFGLSRPLLARCLRRDDWESAAARCGADIWMTTVAVAERFRVCQSFLGARLHDADDAGVDLSALLQQAVGGVFSLMREYESSWIAQAGSTDADLFGFRHDAALDPIEVDLDGMLGAFRRACGEISEIWALALDPDTLASVLKLGREAAPGAAFHLEDELWVRLVYELARAHARRPLERRRLLNSLTPLYLARAASFIIETQTMFAADVEDRVERLCLRFEALKPYLAGLWGRPRRNAPAAASRPSSAGAVEHLRAGLKA